MRRAAQTEGNFAGFCSIPGRSDCRPQGSVLRCSEILARDRRIREQVLENKARIEQQRIPDWETLDPLYDSLKH